MNRNQLVVDKALRATAFDPETGLAAFMLPEIEDYQISVTIANEKTATSASGATVAQLEEGKEGEVTGNASFVHVGLMAAQNGSEPTQSTADKTIVTPMFESFTVKDGKITLKNKPVGATGAEVGYIYTLTSDGTIDKSFVQAATASATEFALTDKEITVPTGIDDGTMMGVYYDFASSTTVLLENNAEDMAKTYRLRVDVLCRDICNQNNKVVVTQEFPNAKLSSAYDLTWGTDQKHPFSFKLLTNYCDTRKNLMKTWIPQD
jgi:hypothetical protein|nr:MAG TPA: putative structural protein [Caudoviricetes sp.]